MDVSPPGWIALIGPELDFSQMMSHTTDARWPAFDGFAGRLAHMSAMRASRARVRLFSLALARRTYRRHRRMILAQPLARSFAIPVFGWNSNAASLTGNPHTDLPALLRRHAVLRRLHQLSYSALAVVVPAARSVAAASFKAAESLNATSTSVLSPLTKCSTPEPP